MITSRLLTAAALCCVVAITAPNASALDFDQNVTPDVIFGSGNDNGAFTTDRQNGIELGLRAKLRFNAMNQPENTFNSNGNGTYSFAAGPPPAGGFGFCPGCPTTPIWNFEWTVNTNFDDSSGLNLADLSYELSLDFAPSCDTDDLIFDNITSTVDVPCWDHALGDNSTVNGGGATSPCADYPADIMALNVAQNSWSYEFFNDPPFDTFDPSLDGTYDISLTAFNAAGDIVARTEIQVIVGAGGTDASGAPCPIGCCDPCDLVQLMAPLLGGTIEEGEPCETAPPVSDPPASICCQNVEALLLALPHNPTLGSSHPCFVPAVAEPPSSEVSTTSFSGTLDARLDEKGIDLLVPGGRSDDPRSGVSRRRHR